MVQKIIQIGDPRLNQVSQEIKTEEIGSKEVQSLIKDLLDTCKAHKREAAGLSAVQLGILKRVCVVVRYDKRKNRKAAKEFAVLINPRVEILDEIKSTEWEGCMSINTGGNKLYGPVKRARSVKVEYLNEKGEQKELVANRFFAHLIQHEVDHMDGILFLSYISDPKNIWREDDFVEYIDTYNSYPPVE